MMNDGKPNVPESMASTETTKRKYEPLMHPGLDTEPAPSIHLDSSLNDDAPEISGSGQPAKQALPEHITDGASADIEIQDNEFKRKVRERLLSNLRIICNLCLVLSIIAVMTATLCSFELIDVESELLGLIKGIAIAGFSAWATMYVALAKFAGKKDKELQ